MKLASAMDRYLIKKVPTVAEKSNPNPGPSPTQPPANKTAKKVAASTIEKLKIDWLGVEEVNKTTLLFCKACRAHPPKHSLGQLKSNHDFGKGSERVKMYSAHHHQTSKHHRFTLTLTRKFKMSLVWCIS